jgi:hypothetical protein
MFEFTERVKYRHPEVAATEGPLSWSQITKFL